MGFFDMLFGKKKNSLEDLDKKNDAFLAKNPVAKDEENDLMRNASKRMTSKDFSGSLALYQQLASNYPDKKGLYESQIGANYYFLEEYEKAVEYYTVAMEKGFNQSMIDDNIWEAVEAFSKLASGKQLAQKYAELFPNGSYIKKVNVILAQ